MFQISFPSLCILYIWHMNYLNLDIHKILNMILAEFVSVKILAMHVQKIYHNDTDSSIGFSRIYRFH